jgi:hypothetical protein
VVKKGVRLLDTLCVYEDSTIIQSFPKVIVLPSTDAETALNITFDKKNNNVVFLGRFLTQARGYLEQM